MLYLEKLKIRFIHFFSNLLYHCIFWFAGLGFFVYLTGSNHLFRNYFSVFGLDYLLLNLLLYAVVIAFIFSMLDGLFSDRLMRRSPIHTITVLRTLFYFTIAFTILLFAAHPPENLILTLDYSKLALLLPELNTSFIRFMLYFYLMCLLNNFLKGMGKRFGRGNLLNWFFGKLKKPYEEIRIFMFIDMKSSTSIAEKLRHKKFSYLVQDIFNDLSVVDNYHGEIYQYLGDGAIISWSLKKGLRNNNFLRSYFAFTQLIEQRGKYYLRKYGLEPRFKAGCHIGEIMILQVGRIRRDISYNGDTLNTTARIESMCNEYRQNLLISGNLHALVQNKSGFIFKLLGDIKLKGKRKAMDLYMVKKL